MSKIIRKSIRLPKFEVPNNDAAKHAVSLLEDKLLPRRRLREDHAWIVKSIQTYLREIFPEEKTLRNQPSDPEHEEPGHLLERLRDNPFEWVTTTPSEKREVKMDALRRAKYSRRRNAAIARQSVSLLDSLCDHENRDAILKILETPMQERDKEYSPENRDDGWIKNASTNVQWDERGMEPKSPQSSFPDVQEVVLYHVRFLKHWRRKSLGARGSTGLTRLTLDQKRFREHVDRKNKERALFGIREHVLDARGKLRTPKGYKSREDREMDDSLRDLVRGFAKHI